MRQHEVPTLTADIPELPVRVLHAPDIPDYDDLTFSEADKEKMNLAAQWGRSLILRARAGDQQALEELRTKMHLTEYKVTR